MWQPLNVIELMFTRYLLCVILFFRTMVLITIEAGPLTRANRVAVLSRDIHPRTGLPIKGATSISRQEYTKLHQNITIHTQHTCSLLITKNRIKNDGASLREMPAVMKVFLYTQRKWQYVAKWKKSAFASGVLKSVIIIILSTRTECIVYNIKYVFITRIDVSFFSILSHISGIQNKILWTVIQNFCSVFTKAFSTCVCYVTKLSI